MKQPGVKWQQQSDWIAGTDENMEAPLTSWRDIARYLGKGVRTVQRWEIESGLPVRRADGTHLKAPVFAIPEDHSRKQTADSADFADMPTIL